MILFEKIKWKNFLSTGDIFTEIDLHRSPSTVIVGDNGAGKSTILDALCYVLFNKPFRNINKPQLINAINMRDMVVDISFQISNVNYRVVRGTKPNVFEIYKNDKLIDQPGSIRDYQILLEDTILKLNYKSFTQIVVLGNASFTPFMQLSTKDRRDVIEDLLDIQIFSNMNVILKDRISENKQAIKDVNAQIELCQEKIKIQKEYLSQVKDVVQKQVDEANEEIKEYTNNISTINESVNKIYEEITTLSESINEPQRLNNRFKKVTELMNKLESKGKKAHKRVEFFENNDDCPTCEQTIDSNIKQQKIEETHTIISKTENALGQLKKEFETLHIELERVDETNRKISEKQNKVRDLTSDKDRYAQQIRKIEKKILSLQDTNETDDQASTRLESLVEEMKQYREGKEKFTNDRQVLELASVILKDGGIKTKIIKQYVPIINKLVNKYLASLDFFVEFQLDEEFNEIIRSRHRDDFSYSSFSEGEKMRIDLALLFTWRSIAKLKNSVNTNLLILDEVFDASLDTSGCDEFLKLLSEVGSDTNVFVISHKGDVLTDKFRSQIRFEKIKNFSRIAP